MSSRYSLQSAGNVRSKIPIAVSRRCVNSESLLIISSPKPTLGPGDLEEEFLPQTTCASGDVMKEPQSARVSGDAMPLAPLINKGEAFDEAGTLPLYTQGKDVVRITNSEGASQIFDPMFKYEGEKWTTVISK